MPAYFILLIFLFSVYSFLYHVYNRFHFKTRAQYFFAGVNYIILSILAAILATASAYGDTHILFATPYIFLFAGIFLLVSLYDFAAAVWFQKID